MINAKLRLRLERNRQKDAVKLLRSLLERVRVLPGCLECRLYMDLEEPEFLLFEESWQNYASLEKHLQSDQYRQILLAMEAASEPPEIIFHNIQETSGMETIEQARAK